MHTYLLSRRLMGAALLVLAINYAIHFFFHIRIKDLNANILLNLVTYFLCYWLFCAALVSLLEKNFITLKRCLLHGFLFILYSAGCCVSFFVPGMEWMTVCLAVLLIIYGLFLSFKILRSYSNAVKMFKESYSEDIGSYIRWLSVFTYWSVIFGISCAVLTFLPDKFVYLWILSAIPFYIYLYCSYQNYIFFYEKVEDAIDTDFKITEEEKAAEEVIVKETPDYHAELAIRLQEWIEAEGYRKPGITLSDLSSQLFTNRTYLSEYINSVFNKNFRDWISDLRIEYTKRLLESNPEMRLQQISNLSGFLSLSHFSRTFSEREGCSPARWRKQRLDN